MKKPRTTSDKQKALAKKAGICLDMYIRNGGRNHAVIEFQMRAAGYTSFNRRVLYGRNIKGRYYPGWIKRFDFDSHLPPDLRRLRETRKKNTFPKPRKTMDSGQLRMDNAGAKKKDIVHYPLSAVHSSPSIGRPGDCQLSFKQWLQATAPHMEWDTPMHNAIFAGLERFECDDIQNLMLNMPPRHGKSELLTIRYTAYRLWRDPKDKIIISCYNQYLANKFSRSIRKILSEEEDRMRLRDSEDTTNDKGQMINDKCEMISTSLRRNGHSAESDSSINSHLSSNGSSPSSNARAERIFPTSRNINTMGEWETSFGGGVKAVGVGGGITGFGGNLIIIDDPVKSRAQAESKLIRDKNDDWFRNDIRTRAEPGAKMIFIGTRWHEDDLGGRILRDGAANGEKWEVITLPAIYEPVAMDNGEQKTTDNGQLTVDNFEQITGTVEANNKEIIHYPLSTIHSSPSTIHSTPSTIHSVEWRKPGEALWPERFPAEVLRRRKLEIGSYAFSALYQQRPSPAQGHHFKREWLKFIVDSPPEGLRWFRGYDLAVSTKTDADYTASFRVALDEKTGIYYIADGFRKRIEYPEQRRFLIERMRSERSTTHGVETALHGSALVQDVRREGGLAKFPLRPVRVDRDKVTRALAWAAHAEAGKLALVRGGWIGDFVEELAAFPHGTHDDQIDAVSVAFGMFGLKHKSQGF